MQTRLTVLLALAIVLAGCSSGSSGPQSVTGDKVGLDATFQLTANPFAITGNLRSTQSIQSPITVDPGKTFPDNKRVVIFPNVTVNGEHGALVIKSPSFTISNGKITVQQISRLRKDGDILTISPRTTNKDHDIEFPDEKDAYDSIVFHGESTDLRAQDITVTGYNDAFLVHNKTTTGVENSVALSPDTAIWSEDTNITASTDSIKLQAKKFSLAGNVDSGTVEITEQNRDVENPDAVFGRDARLDIEGNQVSSKGTFRLTQILKDQEPLIDAAVKVRSARSTVNVPTGGHEWVEATYRETSLQGDALLNGISVKGNGKDMVRVPIKQPPLLTDIFFKQVTEAGKVMPPALLGIAAAPGVILIDALNELFCTFADCPSDQPFPTWIDAGEAGTFYYVVDASDHDPGNYSATITFEGTNYPDKTISLNIQVLQQEN